MSDPGHSDRASSQGTEGANRLLDYVRSSQEILMLPAGSILFREGEPCRGAYFLHEGELCLRIRSGSKELKLGCAKPGHLLGVSSVVSNSDFQCTAHATVESKVAFVPGEGMRDFLRSHADLCLLTVEHLGAELLDLSEKAIRPLRFHPRHS